LYKGDDDIELLTGSNFNTKVLADKDNVWLVQFYSPSCKRFPLIIAIAVILIQSFRWSL